MLPLSFSLFSVVRPQFKDFTQSAQSQRYADDPAYTDDVRHLALPMRRNSGPESRRKSCSVLDTHKSLDREADKSAEQRLKKKMSHANYHGELKQSRLRSSERKLAKYFRSEDSTSSDEELSYGRRGQSLDRNLYKQQKKMLCFQREKEHRRMEKAHHRTAFSSKENMALKSPASGGEYIFQEHRLADPKRMSCSTDRYKHSTATLPLGDRKYSSLHRGETQSFEQLDRPKSKENSKFQIGKRFLKGEIGIKSFNYYLLKESLKSSKKSSAKGGAARGISKSEENIYEEVFFTERRTPRKPARGPKQLNYPDCELCIQECKDKNCAICQAEELKRLAAFGKAKTPSDVSRQFVKMNASNSIESITAAVPNVLQFHSYNPNNPGVYKIETTPVAFTSDYNPLEEIYGTQQYVPPHKAVAQKVSSSSSDSIQHQKYLKSKMRSNYYDRSTELIYSSQPMSQLKPQIYKTDSKASILSEMSIKSENSTNRCYRPAEMSDSSMGDSLFSYPSQRRYYGSAESCRFGYECRRCSLDGDKCSYSDNCRYECRHCDCSSSYFSSDFDDGNFSRKSSARISANSQLSCYDVDAKTTRYAEDFIKHMNNVKKSCNYQSAVGNISSAGPQTERSQKATKPTVRDLQYKDAKPQQFYLSNDGGSVPKPAKPQRNPTAAADISAEIGDKPDVDERDQQMKRMSAAKEGGNKVQSHPGTGTVPKLSRNEAATTPDADATANVELGEAEKATANVISASELCIADCECCQRAERRNPAKSQRSEAKSEDEPAKAANEAANEAIHGPHDPNRTENSHVSHLLPPRIFGIQFSRSPSPKIHSFPPVACPIKAHFPLDALLPALDGRPIAP